jgi:hypothetical protein
MNAYVAALNIPPPPPEQKQRWHRILKASKEADAIPEFPTMWEWAMFEELVEPEDVRLYIDTKDSVRKIKTNLRNAYKTYVKEERIEHIEKAVAAAGITLTGKPRLRRQGLLAYWERIGRTFEDIPVTQTFEEWSKMKVSKGLEGRKSLEHKDWNPYKANE